MATFPYTHEQLTALGRQRTFIGSQLTEIAFPLGGIGTGTISLGGRGNLRDFEIFGRPAKGNVLPFTFFALWTKLPGDAPVARVLEGKIPPPYRNGFGEPQQQLQGLARFSEVAFRGEYPVAKIEMSDPEVPVLVELSAWNPFIPLNVHDSALPVAIFEWTFTNPTTDPVEIALAASISNPLTAKGQDGNPTNAGALNAYQAAGNLRGMLLSHPQADSADPATGTLALATTWEALDVQTRWYRSGWWDKCHLFWDDFCEDGHLNSVVDADPAPDKGDVSSLVLHATIQPGESITLPVFMTWHFPKMANPWTATPEGPWGGTADAAHPLDTYVSAHFADAWAVAGYVTKNLDRLREETERWRDTIFTSTLPAYVLEAITSQASIMRTPTCFLLADGNFFGWEGCGDNVGCCHGNCTHVWNYEQTVAFLFPELERSMRRTEFLHNTRDSGNMAFRTMLPPGSMLSNFKPCVDGQMGTIMQVYRDWQLSGDDAFLREVWPKVKLALEYAWTMTPEKMSEEKHAWGETERSIDSLWDPDKDGVIEGEQHNTYDIEFYGPNPLCTVMYLGALHAGEVMACYLGETATAEEYRAIYESGRAKVDTELWNGEYYIQQVKVIDGVTVPEALKNPEAVTCGPTCSCKQSPGGKAPALIANDQQPKYQHGEGCLADQLLGQWAAEVAGLGTILDPEHVRAALKSIFSHNFCATIGSFNNVQRVYALNDEAGLLLCTWPAGNRPALPFPYSDEVWTGIEFHVAAHLIYVGWIEEGLILVKTITERYSGNNRNPWNHIECGHHYARAMASWSVKLALDGFIFSLPEGRLGFTPRLHADVYRTSWSTGTAWGAFYQQPADGRYVLEVRYGEQSLRRLDLAGLRGNIVRVEGPGCDIAARREGDSIVFASPVTLLAGDALVITTE